MTVATQTVRDIALENPSTIRVFEEFGIDYCCGGRMPLAQACVERSLSVDEVITALESASAKPAQTAPNWPTAPLKDLAAHIVDVHHAYVKREIPRLAELATKVVNRHGDSMQELHLIQSKVTQVSEEMSEHMAKEELILFPHISRLERAASEGTAKPQGCFGTVANPIAMMTREHDAAGSLMTEIRGLTRNFTPPAGACPTFHNFYLSLHEFEQDLHRHVHLENNILFPRAIALESSVAL